MTVAFGILFVACLIAASWFLLSIMMESLNPTRRLGLFAIAGNAVFILFLLFATHITRASDGWFVGLLVLVPTLSIVALALATFPDREERELGVSVRKAELRKRLRDLEGKR